MLSDYVFGSLIQELNEPKTTANVVILSEVPLCTKELMVHTRANSSLPRPAPCSLQDCAGLRKYLGICAAPTAFLLLTVIMTAVCTYLYLTEPQEVYMTAAVLLDSRNDEQDTFLQGNHIIAQLTEFAMDWACSAWIRGLWVATLPEFPASMVWVSSLLVCLGCTEWTGIECQLLRKQCFLFFFHGNHNPYKEHNNTTW